MLTRSAVCFSFLCLKSGFGVQEFLQDRGCSSVGRAPGLQPGGREFEPPQLHQSPVSEG